MNALQSTLSPYDFDAPGEPAGRVFPLCDSARHACAEAPFRGQCSAAASRIDSVSLEFLVSRDEEYVRMYAICGRRAFDLGARVHNYLLLTLARRRLAEAADGLSESAAGWTYRDDLACDLSTTIQHLNIDVFRIRRHFARFGFADPENIVERRQATREMRLGTGKIAVRSL